MSVDGRKLDFCVLGRYALYDAIGSGGMATVHLGRLMGEVGFSRTVAIKRLLPRFLQDPQFVAMFLDEAHMAARVAHPNVVSTIDVAAMQGELFLVMEYVAGESLARLIHTARERNEPVPHRIASAIISGVLHGLHAAHEATSEQGGPLGIVHRDVSPQNVLVGSDGVARVLDFGVAKAARRMAVTREGDLKGKIHYMAPEQMHDGVISRRTDVYAAGLLLWELLTGERFNQSAFMVPREQDVTRPVAPSAHHFGHLGSMLNDAAFSQLRNLDDVVLRALHADPSARFETAREMALALERTMPPATSSEVAEWVHSLSADTLRKRRELVALIESQSSVGKLGASTLMRWLRGRDNPAPGAARPIAAPRPQRIPERLHNPGSLTVETSVRVPIAPVLSPVARGALVGGAVGVLLLATIVFVGRATNDETKVLPRADEPVRLVRDSLTAEPVPPSTIQPLPETPKGAPVVDSTLSPAKPTLPSKGRSGQADWNSRR